jgi:hypothetical protein
MKRKEGIERTVSAEQTHAFPLFGEESQTISFKVRWVRFHVNLQKWALKCCIIHFKYIQEFV